MQNLHFTFLTEKNIPKLHATFLEAFSDYLVPIQLDTNQFRSKLKREGVELTFSAAAYSGDLMVGFILTGLGEWEGKPTAYNAGTGVIPTYRGNRITEQLYTFMQPKFKEAGIEQCLLEVITENAAAIKIYKRLGFSITRTFDCFRSLKKELLVQSKTPYAISFKTVLKPDWKSYGCFGDVKPGWQNTSWAITRSPNKKTIIEAYDEHQDLIGYTVFFPDNGAIAQLAVDSNARCKGIGTALLRQVCEHTDHKALMLLNIDTKANQMLTFLERKHFSKVLSQYEMLLPLV